MKTSIYLQKIPGLNFSTFLKLKLLLLIPLLCLLNSTITFSQTLPLTFSQIPYSDPDIISPGRGAEQWHNGTEAVNNPTSTALVQSLDVYYRFPWNRLEGATQDSYTWTFFDGLVEDAIKKGQKFSFGIMTCYTDGQGQGGVLNYDNGFSSYPLYLHTLMQAETNKDWKTTGTAPTTGNGAWVPNWNSPNYLARLRALHEALYAHIIATSYTPTTGPHNGQSIAYKDVIYCIDIRGYGNYGEWHSSGICDFSAYPSGTQPTVATLKTIIDHHTQVFDKWPLVMMVAAYDGTYTGFATLQIPAEVSHYALTATNPWGPVGFRRDQWGLTDEYLHNLLAGNNQTYNSSPQFKTYILDKYKTAPVTGEPPRYENNDGPTRYWDLENQIAQYGATSFGNGNWGITMETDPNAQTNARAAFKKAGYRIILESGSLSSTITTGTPFAITLDWKNIGIAPTYENWKVFFELKNSSDVTVWSGESQFTPSRKLITDTFDPLLPNEVNSITDNFTLPGSIATGNYKLNLIIKDPNGYRQPLPLAIATARNTDGSYTMRTIGVNVSTATMNAAVSFLARPAAPHARLVAPLDVELYTESNSTLINTYSVTTDQYGKFSINNITPGSYHIGVKNSHSLKKITLSIPLFGGDNTVNLGTLVEGDANNDNSVDDLDIAIIVSSYNKAQGQPGYDDRADLNEDTYVTGSDLSLAVYGYTKPGHNITQGCAVKFATISNTSTCNGQAFDIKLATASGASPYDVKINGTTYNNISVGGTITTITPVSQKIWSTNPTVTSNATGAGIEVGVKFRSSQPGLIKGIRFYSPASVSGTYTGNLWPVTGGTALASAQFTSVTANGWQEVLFTTPVLITANTTYVASYHTTTGRYSSTANGLTNDIYANLLTAFGNSVTGGNGVYKTGASGFPSTSGNGINYWVDVLFVPNTYIFDLTSVTDDNGCNNTRELQTLTVTSSVCTGARPATNNQPEGKPLTAQPEIKTGNSLGQNYPNPFNRETAIQYSLAAPSKVSLTLYDINGRLVKVLLNGSKEAGRHTISFDATPLKKGLYFYKLQTSNFSAVKKMTIQ